MFFFSLIFFLIKFLIKNKKNKKNLILQSRNIICEGLMTLKNLPFIWKI